MSNLNMLKGTILAAAATCFLATGSRGQAAAVTAAGGVERAQSGRTSAARYKDGVYTATGQYGNLPSFLTVTVALASDVITRVEVRTHATNPTSLDYQRRFAAAVPAVVVGKPLSQVKVGRLAGASGCPDGFNAAIASIKAQAAG